MDCPSTKGHDESGRVKPTGAKQNAALPLAPRLLGGLAAGALLAAGFPPYHLPFLLPFGIATLLAQLQDVTARAAAYIGLACGAVYFGATLFWLANLFGAAAISLCAIAAAFIMLFAVLYTSLHRRLPGLPPWALAAVAWTGIEYYRSELFALNFGWVGLGYGLVGARLPELMASWFGSYGLTLGIVTLAALLPACLRRGHRGILAALGLLALWAITIAVPTTRQVPDRSLKVRLVQAGSDDEDSFFALSRAVPDQPVDVVVWPEYSFSSDPRRDARLWQRLREVPRANHAHFVFGAKDVLDPQNEAAFRNTAFVLDPRGELIGRHVKNHTVHFVRDGVAGKIARAIPTALGKLGIAICFDMDYPDVARRLAEDGAEVFLVANMDPLEWGPVQRAQHSLMFRMRAVECGRWLARADVAGGTSVVAPNGRVMEHVTTSEPVKLDVRVGRATGKTPYVRGGWRFGQACLLALALCCVAALLPSGSLLAFWRTRP
jgi:apolipoprotein N-acyltransferase